MKYPPYPRYKPSGIDWLGDVPKHWEVRKFSREVRIAEGQVDPEIEPYASMALVAPNHIESRTGRLLARETAAEQGAMSGKYMCRKDEVVYSKIRPGLAKVALAPEDCLCSADMYPLRPTGQFSSHF
jgi:type I restriction enzyme S subunit